MCFEDSSVFEGQWEAGQRVKGKHNAPDGSWEYAGDWKDETQHGTGVLYRVMEKRKGNMCMGLAFPGGGVMRSTFKVLSL